MSRAHEAVLAALAASGGEATTRELLTRLRQAGVRVPRSQVEQLLAVAPEVEDTGLPGRPRWRLLTSAVSSTGGAASPGPPATSGATTREQLAALELRGWQAEALARWTSTGRGVVEAVTGTGKTRLALAAVRLVADRGGRALVLVPTLELMDQWVRQVRSLLPDLSVGRLGGGHDDDLFSRQVVVATPHSAAAVPVDLPVGAAGLLVADEAHRYGAPTWGAALRPGFTFRLALTATYERGDDGLAEVLEPYFGEVVVRYGFDRAVADGTVAPFRIALVGVRLAPEERERYDRADARARALHRELVAGHGLPRDPAALLPAVTAIVARADAGEQGPAGAGPQVRACREYLVRIRERRETAAQAQAKLAACRQLAPALQGRRSLVFSDTVEQAEDAARVLVAAGIRAETVHGQLPDERRRIRLAVFRRGGIDALVAPRVLDEGVDVPDADLAVVLAAFRTRRQLVQRLGRVLRVKPDGRVAELVVVHALGTREDPAHGGHAEFLRTVREVATQVATIDLDARPDALASWFAPATGPAAAP